MVARDELRLADKVDS